MPDPPRPDEVGVGHGRGQKQSQRHVPEVRGGSARQPEVGRRKLAYPIKGHKKGIYHLAYFKADSLKITEIDHDLRLNEVVLRHMISAIDPKWEEEMLAVAQRRAPTGTPGHARRGPGRRGAGALRQARKECPAWKKVAIGRAEDPPHPEAEVGKE